MILSLIVAADEGNVIGKDNKLPWNLPSDLRYFKNKTWGMPVLMGRKTFESIGRSLPGRKTIVLSRNSSFKYVGIETAKDIEEAMGKAKAYDTNELFVIGGAEIFRISLPYSDRIYLTRIHHHFEGDVFFPHWQAKDYKLIKEKFCKSSSKDPYDHTFQVWERVHLHD